jgi:hypothetical protein
LEKKHLYHSNRLHRQVYTQEFLSATGQKEPTLKLTLFLDFFGRSILIRGHNILMTSHYLISAFQPNITVSDWLGRQLKKLNRKRTTTFFCFPLVFFETLDEERKAHKTQN